ncbi:class I adenylate-forming enzyme family protein [Nonomuraea insulae]|uniref:Class I adenylate-forming enzyme family protein n=2 Tax=Nonomuraea insulae TaxID=1616787 RepID=A0ABW1D6A1_9ACTN
MALVMDNSAAGIATLVALLSLPVKVLCTERAHGELPFTPSVTISRYNEFTSGGGKAEAEEASTAEVLQLTSGSTGEPRIVRHPAGNIIKGARLYRDLYGYTADDKVLLPVSCAHSFGLVGGLAAALTSGAELLTLSDFSVKAIREGLIDGASIVLGSPLLYRMLAASGPIRAPALRVALSSGGPLDVETAAAAERILHRPVLQVYGTTETGLIACRRPADQDIAPESVGSAVPGVEWRLAQGKLLVRTSTMLIGYAGPAGTEPGADGFYDTGDLAEVDEQGRLLLTARKATFINIGGRKVNPRAVERRAEEHPSISQARVFGLVHEHEEEIHAALVVGDGPRPALTDVVRFLRAGLAPHEIPRHLHFVDRLPTTSLGKVSLPDLLKLISEGA